MGYTVKKINGELAEYAFDFGGVIALRNFTARTNGNRLIIQSAENANFTILDALVNEVEIDGIVYDDVTAAQEALQRLVFNPNPPVIVSTSQLEKIQKAIDHYEEYNELSNGIEISGTVYNTTEGALRALKDMLQEALDKGGGKGLVSGDAFNVESDSSYLYSIPEDCYLYGVLVKDAASVKVGSVSNGANYGGYDGNPGGVLELGFLKAEEVYITSTVSTEITPILYMNRPLTGGVLGSGGGSVNWMAIEERPDFFPPTAHTHNWGEIEQKPESFPPDTHTHSYNDLTDRPELGGGRVVIAGKVGYNPRRVIKRFAGNFSVVPYPQHSSWKDHHKIVHNLGHTDYVVTGSGLGGDNGRHIKLNCFYMAANYCYVATADDNTANSSDFVFQITAFE